MIQQVLNPYGSAAGTRTYPAADDRRPFLVGLALSLLIHALLLWGVLDHALPRVQRTPGWESTPLSVVLAPRITRPSSARPSPPPSTAAAPERAHMPGNGRRRPRAKPVIRAPAHTPKPRPALPAPDTAPAVPAPADDMFTQLQAKRQQRAQRLAQEERLEARAEAQAEAPPAAPRARDDNSVALANIARSLRHASGADKINAGGLFEVRNMGYEYAEVVFHGWKPNAWRDATRVIPVRRGAAADIETAIVNKIIAVIREDKSGDFFWDSSRLGRTVALSARPQDTGDLRRFLMQEFFPDHAAPTAR